MRRTQEDTVTWKPGEDIVTALEILTNPRNFSSINLKFLASWKETLWTEKRKEIFFFFALKEDLNWT